MRNWIYAILLVALFVVLCGTADYLGRALCGGN